MAKHNNPAKTKTKNVHLLALAMFGWGFVKAVAFAMSDKGHSAHCPMCVESRYMHLVDPAATFKSVVSGPFMEELSFRRNYPQLMTKVAGWTGRPLPPEGSFEDAADLLFGSGHMLPGHGPLLNAARVMEAGLAGALVYRPAFNAAGLAGATLVHGAHNLGTRIGGLLAIERKFKRPSVAPTPSQPGWPRGLRPR